jgi:hypothetical protein
MTTSKIAVPKDLVIKLDRTMCPGACPDYSLVVHGDGKVLYEGRHYVAVKGRRQGRISATNVKNLFEEFYKVDYFSLKDRYDAIARDGAITKTSISADGRTKVVVNCHPSEAPEGLHQLEKMIDEISRSGRWVKNRSGEPVLEH